MTYTKKYVQGEVGGDKMYGVEHSENNDCQAGLDLTDFGSRSKFQDLVDKFDLEYKRVEGDDSYYYTYSNEDVLLVTGNNPISGKFRRPEQREDETGYASYIGITGKCSAVNELYEYIMNTAVHVKGGNPNEREFI